MAIKRYKAKSIQEAIGRIKEDIGPDAMILSTRRLPPSTGGRQMFEVTAALQTVGMDEELALDDISEFDREKRRLPDRFHAYNETGMTPSPPKWEDPYAELFSIKEMLFLIDQAGGLPDFLHHYPESLNLYVRLIKAGISERHVRQLMTRGIETSRQRRLSMEEITKGVINAITSMIAVHDPFSPKNGNKYMAAFIGPTGVGKTTTLAKLAARYALMKKKKVGLITTDNFRIAAAEQLGTYAKIMGLPMEKASSRETFDDAVRRFSDRDVILVDTPGRARPDDGYLKQIPEAIPDQALETNLLINATGSVDHLENIVTAYSRFRISNLIITKIDESRKFGMLYDIISRTNRPVTYLTCGQNVPQDIEVVSVDKMANLLIGSAAAGGIQPVERS